MLNSHRSTSIYLIKCTEKAQEQVNILVFLGQYIESYLDLRKHEPLASTVCAITVLASQLTCLEITKRQNSAFLCCAFTTFRIKDCLNYLKKYINKKIRKQYHRNDRLLPYETCGASPLLHIWL